MENKVLKLYPLPPAQYDLQGLYLSHNLRQLAGGGHNPFIYGNFVTSLDGRIAILRPDGTGMMVPRNTANDRDWRLYQELAAQADLILSSGRYLREWAEGRAQEILQVDDPRSADLRAWRSARGLPPHPDLAIISSTLQFPLPDILTADGRKVVFFTNALPDPDRVREIESRAGQVIVAGENRVEGDLLAKKIAGLGYRTVYSAAGPQVMHLLVSGGVLNRLYLTLVSRMLGGNPFASIVEGPLLEPAFGLKLNTVYLDPREPDGLGQLFLSFDYATQVQTQKY